MRSINRSGVMYVMLLALFAYVFGLVAVYMQHVAFYAIMALCQLVLGPVLFVYHTMSDKAVSLFSSRTSPAHPHAALL